MPDLTDAIEQAANDPQQAVVNGESVTSRPIGEIIQGDQYLANKDALAGTNSRGGAKSGWAGLRPAMARTEGPVRRRRGDC